MSLGKVFTLIIFNLSILASIAEALDLYSDNLPVVEHQKRSSGVEFSAKQQMTGKDGSVSGIAALLFRNLELQLPSGAGTYDVLKACDQPRVRREPVFVDQEELKYYDLLFYDYNDPSQVRKADQWELPTAPYLEGDIYNPYRRNDFQQDIGRMFELQCLPTRFRFVSIDGLRYLEYREGDRAWDK